MTHRSSPQRPASGVGHRRGLRDQRLVIEHAFGAGPFADPDQRLHPAQRAPQIERLVDKAVVNEQDRGLRVGQRVFVLGQRPADVERRKGAAGPGYSEEEFDIAVAVHCQCGNEAAIGNAQRPQRRGQPGHAVADLVPAAAAAVADRRDAVRLAGDGQETGALHSWTFSSVACHTLAYGQTEWAPGLPGPSAADASQMLCGRAACIADDGESPKMRIHTLR